MPPTVGALPFELSYDQEAADPTPRDEQAGGDSGGGSSPVPEPGALFLVGTGLLGVALTARLRRRERKSSPDLQSS